MQLTCIIDGKISKYLSRHLMASPCYNKSSYRDHEYDNAMVDALSFKYMGIIITTKPCFDSF
jgi:hypothetical protein